jgi:phage tail sheath protein FI
MAEFDPISTNPPEALAALPPIRSAPTSVAAFIGIAARGPVNQPVMLKGIADFINHFGDLNPAIAVGLAISQFFKNGGREAWFVRVGRDSRAADILGTAAEKTGIYALEQVETFNFLCVPGLSQLPERERGSALQEVIQYCQSRRALFLFDLPAEVVEPTGVKRWLKEHDDIRHPNLAVYFPNLRIVDPLNMDRTCLIGPSGTIAGVLSRNDLNNGIWHEPSGAELQLAGVMGLSYSLAQKEIDHLDGLGINCLRRTGEFGAVVTGAKTLAATEPFPSEWRNLTTRRMTLFIQESLHQGTRWVSGSKNEASLWDGLRLQIAAFMEELFQRGAFPGQTAAEAYFVKCDQETTGAREIDQGIVNVLIGFAPLIPGKFVILKLTRLARK